MGKWLKMLKLGKMKAALPWISGNFPGGINHLFVLPSRS